ncbi:cytochrome P450 11B2, mitochondrial [Tachyglossus aculeatus]|uniref:cytochrome P450 11B2, mitochondrial n=1 Tax=Tachyglossus aculeatus TaxID=9261 RepID=UPI0018F2D20A|nr:cytochrome P450 11B2, mitochondrial [Tachyglossus aculeatus]
MLEGLRRSMRGGAGWSPALLRGVTTQILQEGTVREVAGAPQTGALPFDAIPHSPGNSWIKVLRLWKSNSLETLHYTQERLFQQLGPIYREKLGKTTSVNVMLPEDAVQLFQVEGTQPRRMAVTPWLVHRHIRHHKCGLFLLNGQDWRLNRKMLNQDVISPAGVRQYLPLLDTVAQDFSRLLQRRLQNNARGTTTISVKEDLFCFTAEASNFALYGERLGLLGSNPRPEALKFIRALNKMLETTLHLLYLPPGLARLIYPHIWEQHLRSWDHIFEHADKCIQNIYQELCLGRPLRYTGIMAELLIKADLSLESIKANMTELTAGSVDTTAYPLLFLLFELARNPEVQAALREEVLAVERAGIGASGNLSELINGLPLIRGAIKEILRLYPVGIMLQRYLSKSTVLQNYNIPAGTLCNVALYPMGRSPAVFTCPERFDPRRWLGKDNNFRSLPFGFGVRQCIGRRFAESEMVLFLRHILKNFQVETMSREDLKTVHHFILMPHSHPLLTFRALKSDLPSSSPPSLTPALAPFHPSP